MSTTSLTIGVALTVPEPWGSRLQERRAGYGRPRGLDDSDACHVAPSDAGAITRRRRSTSHLSHVAAGETTSSTCASAVRTHSARDPDVLRGRRSRGARECSALAEAVRAALCRRRLPFPYHPHVTLAVELAERSP